jgi:hypothetical protein
MPALQSPATNGVIGNRPARVMTAATGSAGVRAAYSSLINEPLEETRKPLSA